VQKKKLPKESSSNWIVIDSKGKELYEVSTSAFILSDLYVFSDGLLPVFVERGGTRV